MPPKDPPDAGAHSPQDGLFAVYAPTEVHTPLPPGSLHVRAAGPADVVALAPIAQARDGGEFERHEFAFQRQVAAGGDEWHIAAATVDETIVGFGRVNRFTPPPEAPAHTAPAGWFPGGLVVDPAWRRRGVGIALTRHRLRWLQHRTDRTYYFANARNRATIDLHAKFGFAA